MCQSKRKYFNKQSILLGEIKKFDKIAHTMGNTTTVHRVDHADTEMIGANSTISS